MPSEATYSAPGAADKHRGDDLGRVHVSSSSGSSTIGASTRAPSATANAPRATALDAVRRRQREGLHAEQLEHADGRAPERHLRRVALPQRPAHREHHREPEPVGHDERADGVDRVAQAGALQQHERHPARRAVAGRVAEALLLTRQRAQRDAALGEPVADRRQPLVGHPGRDLDPRVDQRVGEGCCHVIGHTIHNRIRTSTASASRRSPRA